MPESVRVPESLPESLLESPHHVSLQHVSLLESLPESLLEDETPGTKPLRPGTAETRLLEENPNESEIGSGSEMFETRTERRTEIERRTKGIGTEIESETERTREALVIEQAKGLLVIVLSEVTVVIEVIVVIVPTGKNQIVVTDHLEDEERTTYPAACPPSRLLETLETLEIPGTPGKCPRILRTLGHPQRTHLDVLRNVDSEKTKFCQSSDE